jgi:hypothetical protein
MGMFRWSVTVLVNVCDREACLLRVHRITLKVSRRRSTKHITSHHYKNLYLSTNTTCPLRLFLSLILAVSQERMQPGKEPFFALSILNSARK